MYATLSYDVNAGTQSVDSVRRASFRSRVDLDFEHSAFAGNDRADWIDKTGTLHHALSKVTGAALTVQQARRFGQSDTQYTAVVGHHFNETWAGYLGAGATPADSFLPKRSYSAGGSWNGSVWHSFHIEALRSSW